MSPAVLASTPVQALPAVTWTPTRPGTGPARTVATEPGGRTATLTDGCYSVVLTGLQRRVFTEQKPPFTDLFVRTRSSSWGTSPDGGVWGNFGTAADSDYSVSGGLGRILLGSTNVSRYVRLNDAVSAGEIVIEAAFDAAPVGASASFSALCGWTDSSNHYRARLTFPPSGNTTLSLNKYVAGAETTIAGPVTLTAATYTAGTYWSIAITTDGAGALSCSAWIDGASRPATPQLTATETTFLTGKLGIRTIANTGVTNTLTALFRKVYGSGSWPAPPVVNTTTYVRPLATPFDGTWSAAIASKLSGWLVDQTPDVLGTVFEFVTAAPSAAYTGAHWVSGNADYGPLSATGTRSDGPDWQEFEQQPYTYPSGTTRTPDPTQAHMMDCSGFTRMVWGRKLGIPMTLTNPAFFTGRNLPRLSKDICDYGPGILVARNASTPPDQTYMLPGDTVYFDADPTDPEEGQIDHVGTYVGTDATSGKPIMISSRKTANGPTMGSLGGSATIAIGDTNLYARTIRGIRRF